MCTIVRAEKANRAQFTSMLALTGLKASWETWPLHDAALLEQQQHEDVL